MMTKRHIGFSHGTTHRFIEPFSLENINIYKYPKIDSLEINIHHPGNIKEPAKLLHLLNDFSRTTFHAPCSHFYQDDFSTLLLLRAMEFIYKKLNASLIVLHPDLIFDVSIFETFDSINWAIENMDDRKQSIFGNS